VVSRRISGNDDSKSAVDSFSRAVNIVEMPEEKIYPGLFGFTSYEAVNQFDNVKIQQQDRLSPSATDKI
jgi:hypothetical protein